MVHKSSFAKLLVAIGSHFKRWILVGYLVDLLGYILLGAIHKTCIHQIVGLYKHTYCMVIPLEQKFIKHGVVYCSCSLKPEDTSHYLLYCHHFWNHRAGLMNSVKSICDNFESMPDKVKKNVLLCGDSCFVDVKNKYILEATITLIKDSEQFSGSLFDW